MQVGGPREVYTQPADKTVADFMGLVNLIPGRIRRARGDDSLVEVAGAHAIAVRLPGAIADGQSVQVAIRPESLRLTPLAGTSPTEPGLVPARIAEVTFLGNLTDCHVTLADGTRVRVQAAPGDTLEVGQPIALRFDPQSTTVFP
jgi:ABC-type Fe3+/spermidine/putrescine transport system ATPase subunit